MADFGESGVEWRGKLLKIQDEKTPGITQREIQGLYER